MVPTVNATREKIRQMGRPKTLLTEQTGGCPRVSCETLRAGKCDPLVSLIMSSVWKTQERNKHALIAGATY